MSSRLLWIAQALAASWFLRPLAVEQGAKSLTWLQERPVLTISRIDRVEIGEIAAARLLHDTTVLVGDRSDNRLVQLDLTGRVIRRFGRTGGGPGEFRQLFSVSVTPEDTVYVYDPSQGHVVFDPSGRFARTIRTRRVDDKTRSPFPVAWLGRGRGLAFAELISGVNQLGWTDSANVLLVDGDLRVLGKIGTLPIAQRYLEHGSPVGVVFGPRLLGVATRGRYCFGFSVELTLRCGGPSGRPSAVTERRPPHPTPKGLMDEYRMRTINPPGSLLNAVPPVLRGQREDLVRSLRFAPVLLAFSALIGDFDSGEVWVGDFIAQDELPGAQLSSNARSEKWTVFAPGGSLTGRLTLPTGFRLLDVRGTYLVGVSAAEDGTESLTVYRLDRGK